jgi:anhydro-N-acetylmuramic acid kinase
MCALGNLRLEDAVATLTEFTAAAAEAALAHLPAAPKAWYVCGGGRHNAALLAALARRLGDVRSVDSLGWAGDALEAQAFAYLAVRSLHGLP